MATKGITKTRKDEGTKPTTSGMQALTSELPVQLPFSRFGSFVFS
jgi:hypothetical protein